MTEETWKLYIIQCADGSLYTGITTDLDRRFAEHESGKGAKYTRGRAPLELLHVEHFSNRSMASVREAQIKSLSKAAKLDLMKQKIN